MPTFDNLWWCLFVENVIHYSSFTDVAHPIFLLGIDAFLFLCLSVVNSQPRETYADLRFLHRGREPGKRTA